MKKSLFAAFFLFISVLGYAQCVPDTSTGNPGVFPPPDSVSCIERGVPYSTTMRFENFTTVGTGPFTAQMVSATIDSLVNFPCGIQWSASKLTYGPGETGCIDVFGTTNDSVGQYPLKIYMTVNVLFFGQPMTQSGEASALAASLGFLGGVPPGLNFAYYSRVINPGDTCPSIDTTGTLDLTAACLGVNISGVTSVCAGTPTTLTADTYNENGTVTYLWSNGATSATTDVTVTAAATFSVTVSDGVSTATASTDLTVTPFPTASFTATVDSGNIVTFGNTSINSTSYRWDFGDGNTSIVQIPPPRAYTENGSVTIELIGTNSCGADTATQTVNITGVFINSVEYDLSFDVFPNPSTGSVALSFTADNASKEYDVKIFDLSGKSVYQEKITAASGTVQKQLDLTALPKGIYTLHLSSNGGFGVKKLQLN